MGILNWLFGKRKTEEVATSERPQPEDELFLFVNGLCKHPAHIRMEKIVYFYDFTLTFPDRITILLNYNTIDKKWALNVWTGKTDTFLYYRYPSPDRTIKYLIEKYNIQTRLDDALKIDADNDAKAKQIEQVIKNKYIGNA